MKEKLITKIKMLFKPILFLIVFIFPLSTFAVWAPPLSSPSGNNVLPSLNISATMQEKFGILKTLGGIVVTFWIRITDGNQALNKVLASDALGFGNWRTLAELGVGTGDGGSGNVDNGNIDGTTNFITKWTGPHTLGNSQIFDNGTNLGIGTQSPTQKLDVTGNVKATQFCLPGTNPTGGCIGVWPGGGGGGPNGWTDDGSVVRLTTSTDKGGVGTATPLHQLQITGNFKMPNTTVNGTNGVIYKKVSSTPYRFVHNFGGSNSNLYMGRDAGNFSSSAQSISNNVGIGHNALQESTTGNDNLGIGRSVSALGSRNIVFGATNATGNDNVIFSVFASGVDGNGNVYYGHQQYGEGNYNVGVGRGSGPIFVVSNNTMLGQDAALVSGIQNATAIGYNTKVEASNTMVFGHDFPIGEGVIGFSVLGWGFGTQPDPYPDGGAAIKVGTDSTNGNGARLTPSGSWMQGSDFAKKQNIENISYGLDEVLALRPVSFEWNNMSNVKDIGFIAQEVEKVIPEIVSGVDGDKAVGYANLTPVLVQAIKELKAKNDLLKHEMDILELEAQKRNL